MAEHLRCASPLHPRAATLDALRGAAVTPTNVRTERTPVMELAGAEPPLPRAYGAAVCVSTATFFDPATGAIRRAFRRWACWREGRWQ